MSFIRKVKNIFSHQKENSRKRDLDILLITAPPWGTHNPPIGLAYLSTFLQQNHIKATVFDGNIEFYRRIEPQWHKLWLPEFKNSWSSDNNFKKIIETHSGHIDWLAKKIISFSAPVLGFSVVDPKERMTIEMIRRILKSDPSKKIIMGGPAISTMEQRKIFLEELGASIDYFVEGPGEEILLKIMNKYIDDGYSVPSEKSGVSPLVVRKEISNLDKIPFPTYHEFNFSLYDGGGFFVEWSRGCISSCAYCKGRHLLGPYRMKKAEHIVAELEYLAKQYAFNHFIVCDNLLNGNINELNRLCDLIIERKLNITWEGQGIPYRKMTLPLLKKMKLAGCTKMQWGVESGSDKLLKNVAKGKIFSVEEVEVVLKNSFEAGINNEIFIIIGLPGENEIEFQKTVDFFKRNHKFINSIKSINTLHLVHGTDLYDYALDRFSLHLPQEDSWYYHWKSIDGENDYPKRVDRARRLITLAKELDLTVQEHNLYEGESLDSIGN